MALRNPSLDDAIAAAAMQEFLSEGYTNASLRRIAQKAGATVGAIQTRYASKDALFVSLVQPFLRDIETTFQTVKADYLADTGADLPSQLKASMQRESEAILRLIFAHYDEAMLFFYRSAGSSLEHAFDAIVKRKIDESVAFFRRAGCADVDEHVLELLLSAQFDSYRRIILTCPDRGSAEGCMNALMTYHFGGWVALFDSIRLTRKEDET